MAIIPCIFVSMASVTTYSVCVHVSIKPKPWRGIWLGASHPKARSGFVNIGVLDIGQVAIEHRVAIPNALAVFGLSQHKQLLAFLFVALSPLAQLQSFFSQGLCGQCT